MSAVGPVPLPQALPQRRLRLPPPLRWLLLGLAVAGSLYLVSPYLTLWKLNVTSVNGPTAELDRLVDIEQVRDQIERRLNKDRDSVIDDVSDAFIDWIQEGIRGNGPEALAHAVTLGWLRQLLLTHAQASDGFWPAISYAFYDSPTHFRVEIGERVELGERLATAGETQPPPVHLRLSRTWLGWRVIAAYY